MHTMLVFLIGRPEPVFFFIASLYIILYLSFFVSFSLFIGFISQASGENCKYFVELGACEVIFKILVSRQL